MRARGFHTEGIIDNSTWIKQTNFPITPGQEFKAAKCIILCKSPFDVLWEKFEEKIKGTKTVLGMNLIKDEEKLFNAFVTTESEKIQSFYEYWLNVPIPYYILRIEDILFDPERTLTQLFQFLFNLESLKGSQIENKILMFLKYNKNYESFLNTYVNTYEGGLANFTLLQKNIAIKIMKNELTKLGYLNPKQLMTFRDDKGFDENEMKMALDQTNIEERWNHEHNETTVKEVIKEYNIKRQYCLVTYMKINSKKTKIKKED